MTLPRPLIAAVGTLTSDQLEEAVDHARDYVRSGACVMPDARDVALALLQLAETCVVGSACARHGGVVHGQEAEELRAGIEQILGNTGDVRGDDATAVLESVRKSLSFLLDRVDARDSLAVLEAGGGAARRQGAGT